MTDTPKVIIPLNHELSLREHGYSTMNTQNKRFKALMSAIKDLDNYSKIQRRLTVLRTYYKKTHTDKYNIFDEDIKKLKEWRLKNPDLYKGKKEEVKKNKVKKEKVKKEEVKKEEVKKEEVKKEEVDKNKIKNKIIKNNIKINENSLKRNKILNKNNKLIYSKNDIEMSYKIIKNIMNLKNPI